MKLQIYQIDAFASSSFEGNPAAVVPLEEWLPDATMQAIAQENNLAETAFYVATNNGFHIRWFTPIREVELCGHATLAAAHVLFTIVGYQGDMLSFDSRSGTLSVAKSGNLLSLDFPCQAPLQCDTPDPLVQGLGKKPTDCLSHSDYIAVLEHEQDVLELAPDPESLKQLGLRGVIVTAPSSTYDFVARFFAPKFGIPEDSVTGSAYTQLVPYWSQRMGKTTFHAKQVSARGGELWCSLEQERVKISGHAVTYMQGTIAIPPTASKNKL